MTSVPNKITYRSCTRVCVLLHCLTSHQSKERQKTKKVTVFFLFVFFALSEKRAYHMAMMQQQEMSRSPNCCISIFQRDRVTVCGDMHLYSLQCLHRKDDWWKWKIYMKLVKKKKTPKKPKHYPVIHFWTDHRWEGRLYTHRETKYLFRVDYSH